MSSRERRVSSNDTSQEELVSSNEKLERLFDGIMKWRMKYDPYNEYFPEVWRLANEKYESEAHLNTFHHVNEDEKIEPSPFEFMQQKQKKLSCDGTNNKEMITKPQNITKDTVDDDYKFDDAEVIPTDLQRELEQMNKITVKQLENETKSIQIKFEKKEDDQHTNPKKMNVNAPTFEPQYETLLAINKKNSNKLTTIIEEEDEKEIMAETDINILTSTSCDDDIQFEQTTTTNQFDTVQTDGNDINYKPYIKNIRPDKIEIGDSSSTDNDYREFRQTVMNENNELNRFQKPIRFKQKFINHSKGKKDFYISKEMITRMVMECKEVYIFDTKIKNDQQAAFAYFKESVSMQINDGEISGVFRTKKGLIIPINIDLHFGDGEIMYLIATENDPEYINRVKWCIIDLMRCDEIYNEYNICNHQLPKSSKNRKQFKLSIQFPPINIPSDIIWITDFKNLPEKVSKQNKNNKLLSRTKISEYKLKQFCYESWLNNIVVPVVVIKGKKQWAEWKKFIQIYDNYGQQQWIGISLRYYSSMRKWKIECLDYDAGRIYYQHKLFGLNQYHKYNYSYKTLSKYVTTALSIY